MLLVVIVVAFVIGIAIGRASIKLTYMGEMIEERPENGRIRYALDISAPLDDLSSKKRVVLKVVPYQDTLL